MKVARTLAFLITLATLSASCGTAAATSPPAKPEPTIQENLPSPAPEESPTPEEPSAPDSESPAPTDEEPIEGTFAIKFTYEKKAGSGSNQFAAWVEDSDGNHVRTFFATRFTSTGGWTYRENALPSWIQSFKPENRIDSEVDAITIQTPESGSQSFSWPFSDENGNPLPAGEYKVVLEATLRQENQVVYEAIMSIGASDVTVEPEAQYKGESADDREMIGDVVFTFTPL